MNFDVLGEHIRLQHRKWPLKLMKILGLSKCSLTDQPRKKLTWNQNTTQKELQSASTVMRDASGRTTLSTALHKSGLCGRGARWKVLLRRKGKKKKHTTACLEFAEISVKFSEGKSQRFDGLTEQK